MEEERESAQLKGYIDSISHEALRQESADMLVGSSMTTQEYKSSYSVVFANEKYISFRAEEYSYAGGAHGSNKITVGIIDRKTGSRLRLADFVPSDKLPELTKLLREKVVKKIGGKENLQGDVRPIENFCVVEGGLKFVYNEYEVACYAAGAIEVVVSFDELIERGSRVLSFAAKQEVSYTAEDVKKFREGAEKGDIDSQVFLAGCYLNGWGVAADHQEAIKWVRLAAEQGDADGIFLLGACNEYGYSIEKNVNEAVRLYRKVAERGHIVGQRALGLCYWSGTGTEKSYEEAAKWFLKAAEQGDPESQRRLAWCFMEGKGMAKSQENAFRWYLKAAEQGDAQAQLNAGVCCDNGIGVCKNPSEAFKWYRKAAEQGLARAELFMGLCYENGIGVATNLPEAVKWYRKAADNGEREARECLAVCYRWGRGVEKDEKKAKELLGK